MTALVILSLISEVVFSGKVMVEIGFSLEVSVVTVIVFETVGIEVESGAEDEEANISGVVANSVDV